MKHRRSKRAVKSKPASSKKPVQKAALSSKPYVRFGIALVLLSISVLFVVIARIRMSDSLTWKSDPAASFRTKSGSLEDRMPFPPTQFSLRNEEPTFDDFVGSDVCADCHKEQFDLWKHSTHGRAGGPPGRSTVISNFDGTAIRLKDAVITPVVNEENEYLFIVEQTGFPKRIFKVDAVIGGGHMHGGGTQSYFSEFPDGTVRFLPFDFIHSEKLWFGQIKNNRGWLPLGEDLSITDLIEWPPSRILGADREFSNCQECHGSQISGHYDVDKQRYITQYRSLTINCESCHGPGKRHVQLANSDSIAAIEDIGMRSLSTFDKDESLEVCFQCHSTKDVIEIGYLPGKEFENYYSLKFPMGGRQYHPDGRLQFFGYQQNHLYSDCYRNGSMTCVDCHAPHSLAYRDINGNALNGRFDNGQCTGCHVSKGISPEKHTHHKSGTAGSLCTSCHMPYLQHKGIGDRLRFARSDHTIPVPRLWLDAKLGVENACKQCHQDKTNEWLAAMTTEWYGELKPLNDLVAGLLEAGETDDRRWAAQLVFSDSDAHPMEQMAGLFHFMRKYLAPNMTSLEAEIIVKIKQLCDHRNIDIKSLAFMSLHLAQGNDPDIRSFLIDKVQTLGEREMAVRNRWAMALNSLGVIYRNKGDYQGAMTVLMKALEITPDNPAILSHLGITFAMKRDYANAILNYRRALKGAPNDPMIYVNLGIAYRENGDSERSLKANKKALELNPRYKLALFNLGNLLYEAGSFDSATVYYERAVEADPSFSAGHFYLARAYVKKKQLQDATASLKAGLQFDPNNREAKRMLEGIQAHLSMQ